MDNGTAELPSDLLARSASALKERIAARRAEVATIAEELRRSERELQLLQEIMRLRGDTPEEDQPPIQAEADAASPPVLASGALSDGNRLADAVVQVLRDHGQQMHIQELMAAVRAAGLQIPGRGEPANLIAHIRTHPSIVRPVRGMYGLREWGLVEKPVQPRAARKRGARTVSKARPRRTPRRRASAKREKES